MLLFLYLPLALAAAQPAPAVVTAAPRFLERRAAQGSEFSVLLSDAFSLLGHIFPSEAPVTTTSSSARSTAVDHKTTQSTHTLTTTSRTTGASEKHTSSQGTQTHSTVSSTSSKSTTSFFATSTTRSTSRPSTTSRSTTPFASIPAAAASPTNAPTRSPTAKATNSSSNNPNQATIIVLAILCTIFGLIALGCLLWYLYQAYRRRKASETGYESDSEAGDYNAEPQMVEDMQHRYDDKTIPPLPLDAHRYSRYEDPAVSPSSDPGNPFGTPAPSIAPAQRPESLPAAAAAAPLLYQDGSTRWSTGPSSGPWAPPSPNRPRSLTSSHHYPNMPQRRSFDFGFGAEESVQESFLQSRRSAPRLSTGSPLNSPMGPSSPLTNEPWSAGSGDLTNEGSRRPSRYQNSLYHINETSG